MEDAGGMSYSVRIDEGAEGMDPADDNVDVEVRFDDGRRYSATFFTLDNLRSLFAKNEQTGECGGGLYLWASEMILVRELSEASISATIAGLIREGEFEGAFCLLD